MKNQISFMSGLFDTKELSPPVANDRHFGEDLALWIAEKSNGGEFVFGKPVRSADGWSESVTAGSETFVLGFGIGNASAGEDYAEWMITIDKSRSWRSFGSKDSPSRSRLCDLIHNILRDERQIREVQWL
ncbi:MAG TPA: hypothetical protein VHQ01_05305 [Pyrinomonadaceae bacterium]|nr:hypothetical protein [Pyrinomonadaceae bacterium]